MQIKPSSSNIPDEAVFVERKEVDALLLNSLKAREVWYLIDNQWFTQYKKYSDESNRNACNLYPGPIDNSLLVLDQQTKEAVIKHGLQETNDYVLIPESGWNVLKKRFGLARSCHELGRKVIEIGLEGKVKVVELHPFELNVKLCTDRTVSKHMLVSRSTRIAELIQKISELFMQPLSFTNSRIFIEHMEGPMELIEIHDPDADTIDSLAWLSGQKLLVDLKNSQGEWTVRDSFETVPAVLPNKSSSTQRSSLPYRAFARLVQIFCSIFDLSANFIIRWHNFLFFPLWIIDRRRLFSIWCKFSYFVLRFIIVPLLRIFPWLLPPEAWHFFYRYSARDPHVSHVLHTSSSSNYIGRTPAGFMNTGPVLDEPLISSASTENFNKRLPPLGLSGLSNLGNTCFMNSALQCMSNTSALSEYFVSGTFEQEINELNPLGMKGEMARAFGGLMKSMWALNETVTPRIFKTVVGRFAPQFSGYQQQDSQELLAFLLDGLHEDLNRIRQKPYIESKDVNGMPESEAAAESWKYYKMRNDSIIIDLFHGQLKSTLVCPVCSKRSVTFDPFCYLSLPLTTKKDRSISLLYVPVDPRKLAIECQVSVSRTANVQELAGAVSKMMEIKEDRQLVFAEVQNGKVSRVFAEDELIQVDKNVVAFETIHVAQRDRPIFICIYNRVSEAFGMSESSSSYYTCDRLVGMPLLLVVARNDFINVTRLTDILKLVSSRFVDWDDEEITNYEAEHDSGVDENGDSNIDESLTASDSVATLPESSKTEITNKSLSQNCNANNNDDLLCSSVNEQHHNFPFRVVLTNSFGSDNGGELFTAIKQANLSIEEQQEQDKETVAASLKSVMYICLEWDPKFRKFFVDNGKFIQRHESSLTRNSRRSISLYDCLDLFTTTEKLGKFDSWYCPQCKSHQQATKKFDIWNLPEILIIHLKRFSNESYYRNKLETLVEFPLEKLNVKNWVTNENCRDTVYDLIAVSNHYGGLGGGHYTAYAKNKASQNWYCFDDARVDVIEPNEVVSRGAYVLIYCRKRENSGPNYGAEPNFEVEHMEDDSE